MYFKPYSMSLLTGTAETSMVKHNSSVMRIISKKRTKSIWFLISSTGSVGALRTISVEHSGVNSLKLYGGVLQLMHFSQTGSANHMAER